MREETLLVVDTDSGFPERFRKRLEIEEIGEQFVVTVVRPDTTRQAEEMISGVVHDVSQLLSSKVVAAVFVDVVVYEGAKLDAYGIRIAEKILEVAPQTPVFCVTAKTSGSISEHMDHFAEATLSSVDGVFPKSYLEDASFSARRLKHLLERGREKRGMWARLQRRSKSDVGATVVAVKCEKIRKRFGKLEARVAVQIDAIGETDFWRVIDQLFPDGSGELFFVSSGASGAIVIGAHLKNSSSDGQTTGAKKFLVKISADREAIAQEARNRSELVLSPAPRENFPLLIRADPCLSGPLSGVAYEFEAGYQTLLEWLSREIRCGANLAGVGARIFEVVSPIYGDPALKVVRLWNGLYRPNDHVFERVRGLLSEKQQVFEALIGAACFQRVNNFFDARGEAIDDISDEIDQRHIHGDFNCGNILIGSSARNGGEVPISIIDFGSRCIGHIARDIAKLERDIVLRVFDWGNVDYYSPSRMKVWRTFLASVSNDAFRETIYAEDCSEPEVGISLHMIQEMRTALRRLDSRWNEGKSYQFALLHYSILGVLHEKLSTVKRAFSLEYVDALASALSRR